MRRETTHNYHNALSMIKDSLDPLLKIMQDKDSSGSFWKSVKGPFKSFLALFKQYKTISFIKAASLLSLPILGPIFTGWFAAYKKMPKWEIVVLCVAAAILVYGCYVVWYRGKMIIPGNPEFHIGLFKKKRKVEYERYWKRISEIQDFSFSGLYTFVSEVFGIQTGEVSDFIRHLQGQVVTLEQHTISYEASIAEYKKAVIDLTTEQNQSDETIEYLMEIIRDLNISLYRLVNGKMSFGDLAFIAGFTIYQREDNRLVKIADERTTGVSPEVIDLEDSRYTGYAVVIAAKTEPQDPIWNTPYLGHYVVSKYLRMNGSIWIFSFHFDERDVKALSLTLKSDIIETREIYRIFHVLCLILQKSAISLKDGDVSDEYSSK